VGVQSRRSVQHTDLVFAFLPPFALPRLPNIPARPCDAAAILQEVDPQFEPVHKLTEQVAVTTGEEGDAVIFKMCVTLRPSPK
jgi:hypothetical protein